MLDMLLIDNPVVTNCLIDQVCQSFISSPVYGVVVFTVSKTLCLLCHEKYMHKAFAMSNCTGVSTCSLCRVIMQIEIFLPMHVRILCWEHSSAKDDLFLGIKARNFSCTVVTAICIFCFNGFLSSTERNSK